MDKKDRVANAINFEKVDRPPYSFWTHFPKDDLDPNALVQKTIEFANKFDLDFVKAMPNGNFCTEDWGVISDFSQIAKGGIAKSINQLINSPQDWEKIKYLDINQGAFAREIKHLQLLCKALPDRPILATTFSPLTVMFKIGGAKYREHCQSHPQLIKQTLDNITKTMVDFVKKALSLGCAGIYFATQESSYSSVSEGFYRQFGEPYDNLVMLASKSGWFNVIHMHGENIMFDLLKQYPVTALNWHIGECEPTVCDYINIQKKNQQRVKPIVGGIVRSAITNSDIKTIEDNINTIIRETDGKGILLSPACVIRYPINPLIIGQAINLIIKNN